MRRMHQGLALILILAGLQVSACTRKADTPSVAKPSKVERVPGTDLNRVTLSPKAAERLDIKTVPVRDEQLGSRKRLVGGEVVATPQVVAAADNGRVWVRVPLSPRDLGAVAAGQTALVRPVAREADGKAGTMARPVTLDTKEPAALHYTVDRAAGLVPGQRVRIELPLSGAGTGKVVPHGALLYDAQGKTWVYINAEPLVFVRHPIGVAYIDGDRVVLSDGPAPGTAVVTVGVAELFGIEHGLK